MTLTSAEVALDVVREAIEEDNKRGWWSNYCGYDINNIIVDNKELLKKNKIVKALISKLEY